MKKLIINSMYKYNLKVIAFSPTQIIVLGFLSLIFIGSLLLSLPFATRAGSHIGFSKALFTSTSAVCVTGLVVVDTNTTWSAFGQTVILFLIQAGGLGIMASATLFSLIIGRRVSLKERLTIQESLNEFSLSGVVRMLKNILIATFTIELAGAFLLSFRLIPLYGISAGTFKSVFHSVSAFCNAGFDLFGSPGNEFTSLTPFANDPFVILPITLLFIIGGLGFVVWRDVVLIGKCKSFMLHTKVVLLVTSILILLGSILIFIFEYNNPATLGNLPLISKITNAYFQAVTPRTAGFNTLSLADMSDSSKFLTILFMFIGGAPGSTAGGVKITTVSIIIFAVISYIKGQTDVNIMQRKVPHSLILKSLSIIMISAAVIITTTMVLLLNNEGSFIQVLFESVSAFGTVGLSTGITPDLNKTSMYMIIITMFVGRVGPLTAAVALSMRHRASKLPYKYPEGRITVG